MSARGEGTARRGDSSGHTPGPWLIEYVATGVRWPVIYVRDDAWEDGKREIAELSGNVARDASRSVVKRWRKTPDADETNANAALIAAAPEMKDALQGFVDRHQQEAAAANFARCGCSDCVTFRAALTKARALTSAARKPT